MEDALRRGASNRKRAAALRRAARDPEADPKLIKLMLETANELEAEATCPKSSDTHNDNTQGSDGL